jgi:hypothetical protein
MIGLQNSRGIWTLMVEPGLKDVRVDERVAVQIRDFQAKQTRP